MKTQTQTQDSEQQETTPKKPRGFAAMPYWKRAEVAHLGGKAAHANGTAHKWTPEEAQEAGRKGGTISRRRPRHVA